jgi:hypothetical protein
MNIRNIMSLISLSIMIAIGSCKDDNKKSERAIEDNTSSDGLSRKNTEDPKDSARKAFLAKDSAEAAQPEPSSK